MGTPTTPRIKLQRADRPPRGVTRDLYLVWRAPRVGMSNAQRLTNPVWSWLAGRRELNAWMANQHFRGPSSMLVGPGWCGSRFGQSTTALPDGRAVSIGGEHEDYYDPDFYIYNDVHVASAEDPIEVYGYPTEDFPPTDFHTATLAGGRIWIIGCLGYAPHRRPGETPVFALDTNSLTIGRVATTGDKPGWIFRHAAELSPDGASITVRGGERVGDDHTILANIDDWSLDLASLAWTRLTDRRWPLFALARADGGRNTLQSLWLMSFNSGRQTDYDREQVSAHTAKHGWTPDFALYAARYAPPVAHAVQPWDEVEPVSTTRVTIDGVTVRYSEEGARVLLSVEGALAAETIDAVVEDARRKLGALEHCEYVASRLR
ncbi:MAG: hypothetical protein JWM10_3488 [Myxococcaceae bacterium]|nr:hypothetical protein [Myxococcaceae bacterium]